MPYTTCFWLRTLITQRSCALLGLPGWDQSHSCVRPSWQSWICVPSLSRLLCSGWEAVGLQDLFALWIKKPQPALPRMNTHSRKRLLRDPPARRSRWAGCLWTGIFRTLFNQCIAFGGIYESWWGRCETPHHFCLTCCCSKELQQLSLGWDDWLEVIFHQVTFAIITWCFACSGGNNQHDLQKALRKVALVKTIIWTSYYDCSRYS